MELQGTIGTTLEYFLEPVHATRQSIQSSRESLVLQTDFLKVKRVDICIEFLKSPVRSFFFLRSLAAGLAHTL